MRGWTWILVAAVAYHEKVLKKGHRDVHIIHKQLATVNCTHWLGGWTTWHCLQHGSSRAPLSKRMQVRCRAKHNVAKERMSWTSLHKWQCDGTFSAKGTLGQGSYTQAWLHRRHVSCNRWKAVYSFSAMFAFIACEANHHTWKNKENKAIADIIIGDQQNKWFQWRWSWEKKKKKWTDARWM